MSARDAITSLLNRYSFTVDTGDFEGFLALYADGAWSVEGAAPNDGPDAIRANVIDKIIVYPDGTPRTRHVTTNVELAIDEAADRATGQRYVTVLQQTDELPLQAIFSGHYHDEFVCENGTWRFASTVVRSPFVGNMSGHLKGVEFISGEA